MTNTLSIPTYSLQLHLNYQEVQTADEIIIFNRKLSPADAKIPQIILRSLEGISRDYVYEVGKNFKPVKACLSFSPQNGMTFISCTDNHIKEITEKTWNEQSPAVAIPKSDVVKAKITHLKRRDADEKVREIAYNQFKEKDILFIDPLAYTLWQSEITHPIEIHLAINGFIPTSQVGGGVTTGILRYPHMLKDLYMHFKEKRLSDQTNVCIMGPGLFEEEEKIFVCPQFVELFALFPNANFVLLDNHPHVLDVIKKQIFDEKCAVYDPLMFRNYPVFKLDFYQDVFKEMKNVFTEKAIFPKNAKKMLEGSGKLQYLKLRVEPKKIKINAFDIHKSQFDEKDKRHFDVIIATMSISLELADQLKANPAYNSFSLLGKFLATLKEGGALYVDSLLIQDLFITRYGQEGWNVGLEYLESLLGNKLSVREIPLSDFQPGLQGNMGTIWNASLFTSTSAIEVTTFSITVVTRQSEKVEWTREEKQAIQLKMVKLLRSQAL